jgi:sarcosine oxidase
MHIIEKDVVVVGLGAFGSAALWRLAERGIDVAGIERYGIGHHLGSSHGATRLFRVACKEHVGLSPIALKSLDLWTALGEQTGEVLVRQTGCLSVGRADSPGLATTVAAAEGAGVPITTLTGTEVVERFPGYVGVGEGDIGIWDPWAGICYPEKNVRAQTAAAERAGAEVYSNTMVTAIEIGEDHVVITTPTVTFHARQVVVAAGAWLGKLVPNLPLTPRRTPLYWFAPKDPASTTFTLENFPAFMRELPSGMKLWGHGSDEDYGIKIGMIDTGTNFSDTDADEVDRYIHQDSDIDELSSWVAQAFPDVNPQPDKVIACMVTNSPDEQFLVGRPEGTSRLVIAGGDSGHGFKHAAGIGELLAQITVGETPYVDASFMDTTRFEGVAR